MEVNEITEGVGVDWNRTDQKRSIGQVLTHLSN